MIEAYNVNLEPTENVAYDIKHVVAVAVVEPLQSCKQLNAVIRRS